jgi:hypothetical protein
MREYSIKRGHDVDLNSLVAKYFGADGDIVEGIRFTADGMGDVTLKREKNRLLVDIVPPKKITGDGSIVRKWNEFLFEATGKDAKERKKDFGKI